MSAFLKAMGIEAVSRERLMMVVSTQSKAGLHSWKRDAGMGSRLQDLIGDFVMNFWSACGVIGTKDKRVDGEDGSEKVMEGEGQCSHVHQWDLGLRDVCRFYQFCH